MARSTVRRIWLNHQPARRDGFLARRCAREARVSRVNSICSVQFMFFIRAHFAEGGRTFMVLPSRFFKKSFMAAPVVFRPPNP
jgi:hypothetical protein